MRANSERNVQHYGRVLNVCKRMLMGMRDVDYVWLTHVHVGETSGCM